MTGAGAPRAPYQGLTPYTEEDAQFFFGRDREREIIIANLMAARLTLLYGASGVGKSSVLRAGVSHYLRRLTQRNLTELGAPEFAVVVFNAWRDDPVAGLVQSVREAVAAALDMPPHSVSSLGEGLRLAEALDACGEYLGGDLLVVLDQFEEYFLYHPQEEGEGTFAVEFPRAVNRPGLRASFLIAIREDALAKLDRFKGRIPSLFDNYLRIEHLDRDAARAAIEKPVEQYNRLYADGTTPIEVEPALVEAVLDQVQAGKVVLGDGGRGVTHQDLAPAQIETPYLQLVMTRLWDQETSAGSPKLRLATLDALGGAERIVRNHVDTAMDALPPDEQEVAAHIFHHLVTPSGTKITHTVPDLAQYAELPQAQLALVLERLAGSSLRILRPIAPPPDAPDALRYEIFHDVLAPAILDWRRRYADRQAQEEVRREEQERRQREREEEERRRAVQQARWLRAGVLGLTLLLVAITLLAVIANRERNEAEVLRGEAQAQATNAGQQRGTAEVAARDAQMAKATAEAAERVASSRELAASASSVMLADPVLSMLLAIEAGRKGITLEAESVLRQSLLTVEQPLTLLSHGAPVVAAVVSPDARSIATGGQDGSIYAWESATGSPIASLGLPGSTARVTRLAFSPDGRWLVMADEEGVVAAWRVQGWMPQGLLASHLAAMTDIAFSPDGSRLVTTSADGTAVVLSLGPGPGGQAWRETASLVGHEAAVTDAAFSPDGSSLVTGSEDGTARVWQADTGQALLPPLEHASTLNSVTFSPDGKWIVTASSDGTAQVWEAGTGVGVQILAGHDAPLAIVAFSPDGSRLVTVGADLVPRLWDVATWQFWELRGHADRVRSAAFSRDGEWVVTGSADGTTRIWSAATGRSLGILRGHSAAVNAAVFSPDGRLIVTVSDDTTGQIHATAPLGLSGQVLLEQAHKHKDGIGAELTCEQRNRYLHEEEACPTPGPTATP